MIIHHPKKNNPKTITKKDLPFLESSNKNRLFFSFYLLWCGIFDPLSYKKTNDIPLENAILRVVIPTKQPTLPENYYS